MSEAQDEFDLLMSDKSRRTRHPEDDSGDDDRGSVASRDGENEGEHVYEDGEDDNPPPPSTAQNVIPRTPVNANTGPKGVISDAQTFRKMQREHSRPQPENSAFLRQVAALSTGAPPSHQKVGQSHGEEGEEDAELDDDFMQEWRAKRIKELEDLRGAGKKSAGREKGYGTLVTVDGDGYLEAVDQSPTGTVVAVYIYDDSSQVSEQLESYVCELAATYRNVRFVRLHYEEAQMEPAGVPSLIAYRNGDKFAALVPLVDELPDDAHLGAAALEQVLLRHQMIAS